MLTILVRHNEYIKNKIIYYKNTEISEILIKYVKLSITDYN